MTAGSAVKMLKQIRPRMPRIKLQMASAEVLVCAGNEGGGWVPFITNKVFGLSERRNGRGDVGPNLRKDKA
jgi:hypothetical protein